MLYMPGRALVIPILAGGPPGWCLAREVLRREQRCPIVECPYFLRELSLERSAKRNNRGNGPGAAAPERTVVKPCVVAE